MCQNWRCSCFFVALKQWQLPVSSCLIGRLYIVHIWILSLSVMHIEQKGQLKFSGFSILKASFIVVKHKNAKQKSVSGKKS